MLASMLPVLKQINIVSEYLQNQEVATIGVILPVVQGLLRNLDTTEKWELRQQHERNPAPMTVIEHFKIIAGDHLLKRFHENKIQWELLLSFSTPAQKISISSRIPFSEPNCCAKPVLLSERNLELMEKRS